MPECGRQGQRGSQTRPQEAHMGYQWAAVWSPPGGGGNVQPGWQLWAQRDMERVNGLWCKCGSGRKGNVGGLKCAPSKG